MQKELTFPCEQCGATLIFSAATGELTCPYCAHINVVEQQFKPIVENDYLKAMVQLQQFSKSKKQITSLKCPSCAAVFDLHEDTHASTCPFCGSAVVNETQLYRPIKPQALLPFKITKAEAKNLFRTWIKSRWFAPNKLKRFSGANSTLLGVYVPHWTFDSDTFSRYTGRRGDEYYVTESYYVTVEGRQERRERRVTKVKWHSVSGTIEQSFDDVLVMASQSRMNGLQTWDLENLVPYAEHYLSGFESEVYTVELNRGFVDAKGIMQESIRYSIRRQIGGDRQEITSLQSEFNHVTFKHILLPIYASAYRFNNKVYNLVINGRNGEIKGDRPYSVVKIVLSVLAVTAVAGAVWYYMEYVK